MKQKSFRPPITTRELAPQLRQTKEGIQLLCPFCNPPHALLPGQESTCGTSLRVTAVQTVIPARTVRDKNLTCMKCHQSGRGEMVRFGSGFIHLVDCAPGTRLLAQPPANNRLAERVYKMKSGRVRSFLERQLGRAQVVENIENEQPVSYFFLPKAQVNDGKHTPTHS